MFKRVRGRWWSVECPVPMRPGFLRLEPSTFFSYFFFSFFATDLNIISNKCQSDGDDKVLRVNDAEEKGRRGNSAGLKFQMEPIEQYQNVFKANVKADARKGSGGGGGGVNDRKNYLKDGACSSTVRCGSLRC